MTAGRIAVYTGQLMRRDKFRIPNRVRLRSPGSAPGYRPDQLPHDRILARRLRPLPTPRKASRRHYTELTCQKGTAQCLKWMPVWRRVCVPRMERLKRLRTLGFLPVPSSGTNFALAPRTFEWITVDWRLNGAASLSRRPRPDRCESSMCSTATGPKRSPVVERRARQP